ncbi:DUF3631 domain-containing protein [Dactylosporangium siamense]|uniref:DUF3631 domain-containing protein n=1 Tax=Dactylosporangium siamense TaxID=685454 RepID=A0A919PTI1_9ACTN|nr:DUF3631 domain-containing protein [Dactylosporangium siamense]GIG48123.1 hypothetical protein Dsi01nite_061640 [Dactylosporangium siamense]
MNPNPPHLEPDLEPIDGAALLNALHEAITRYVILPVPEAVDAVALWIAATHAQPAWAHAPRMVIRAPERRCGKSRLLDIVEAVCFNPLITVNASTAAVYRSIGVEGAPPTLLIDEADTIFGGKVAESNEDLRGLLNAGHQRNRPTIRWDPNTRSLERIQTFAMAALAGIGAMPDTIEDRAVIVRMRRRAPGEKVAPYRVRRDGPPLRDLGEQITAWLRPFFAELEKAEPLMPLEDRAADTWEPLIAVADLAGGSWPARARLAARVLTEAHDDDAVSERVRLLNDCRAVFADHPAIPTTVLLDLLKADPESPWTENGPNGLSAARLAGMLREFGIKSVNIRFPAPTGQVKGYRRGDFIDAWDRYASPESADGGDSGEDAPVGAVPAVPPVPAQVSPGTAF